MASSNPFSFGTTPTTSSLFGNPTSSEISFGPPTPRPNFSFDPSTTPSSPTTTTTTTPSSSSFTFGTPLFSSGPPTTFSTATFSSSPYSSSSSSSSAPPSTFDIFRPPHLPNPFGAPLPSSPSSSSSPSSTSPVQTSPFAVSAQDEPFLPVIPIDEQSPLFCSIHYDVMRDPVTNSNCKHTYCKSCIGHWNDAKRTGGGGRRFGLTSGEIKGDCPICRAPLDSLERNCDVETQILQLVIHCRYGCEFDEKNKEWIVGDPKDGYCPETVTTATKLQHEKECICQLTTCPFGGASLCVTNRGKPLRRKDIEQHRLECPFALVSTSDSIRLNIGGELFVTTKSTLRKDPASRLASLAVSGRTALNLPPMGTDNAFFIDRDPSHFQSILNYLRDLPTGGALHGISSKSFQEIYSLLQEAKFYNIAGLITLLSEAKLKKEEEAEEEGLERKRNGGRDRGGGTEVGGRRRTLPAKFVALRASSNGSGIGAERVELGMKGWSEPRVYQYVHEAMAEVAMYGYEPYSGPCDWLEATFPQPTATKPNERTLYFKLDPTHIPHLPPTINNS